MAISGITITIDQGNNVGEVGSDSPLSLAQLSNITSTLRDAGLSSKEIIKVLEALLQLADEEQKKSQEAGKAEGTPGKDLPDNEDDSDPFNKLLNDLANGKLDRKDQKVLAALMQALGVNPNGNEGNSASNATQGNDTINITWSNSPVDNTVH